MNPEPPPVADPHSTMPTTTRKTLMLALTYWFFGLLVSVADFLFTDAVVESLVKSGLQQGLTPRFFPLLISIVVIVALSAVAFLLIRRGLRIWKRSDS